MKNTEITFNFNRVPITDKMRETRHGLSFHSSSIDEHHQDTIDYEDPYNLGYRCKAVITKSAQPSARNKTSFFFPQFGLIAGVQRQI